jgi:hypothetical protein
MFKCEICGREFENLRGFEIHNGKIHKKEIVKEFKCEICGKEFKTLKGLLYHITTWKHEDETIKEFKCEICGRKFETLRGMQSHAGYRHKKEIIKEFKCEICGKEFEKLRGLLCHIVIKHENEIIGKFICEICGKEFNTLRGLQIHNGMFHKKINVKEIIKEIKCELCGRKFETLKGLTAHIGHTHNNEITIKEYYLKFIGEKGKCAECGKDTYFVSSICGYNKFCSNKCSSNNIEVKNKFIETSLKKFNCKNPLQNLYVKEKSKITNMKNLGVEYSSQNPENRKKAKETILKNNNGIHPNKLTYKQIQEKYPDLVKIEKLKEGSNGEIWGHCKNSSCKNSEENGGYFKLTTGQIYERQRGINSSDTSYFYCCEECKHSCPLFNKSAAELHNLINEDPEIPYTPTEYNTWREEVYYRQRIENNTDTNFCEYCHATENLQVHHEVPQKIVPGYALDPINGIIACEDCHYKKGHKKGTECSTGNLASKICK